MTGRLIAIVGPSGVGKDSVMIALQKQDARIVLARGVITRPSETGCEDFEGVKIT
jgi:ribose 1,5-bisphosphokinase